MRKNFTNGLMAVLAFVVAGIVAFSLLKFLRAPEAAELSSDDEIRVTVEKQEPRKARVEPRPVASGRRHIKLKKEKDTKIGSRQEPRKLMSTADRTDLPLSEKELMSGIEKAQDEDDLEQLRQLIPQASVSTNVEIRSDLVDALGWFGKDAMEDLLPFMADEDEDVRNDAIDYWTGALGEIEDVKSRGSMIEMVMKVIKDEDALDAMTTELSDLEDIDALQVLVNVMSEPDISPNAVKAAKEHYEFVTGEEWKDIDAAEAWLRENMDEPEDDVQTK